MSDSKNEPAEFELPDNVRRANEACLLHAERLLDAGRRLLADPPHANIAFHLIVLALEEIGKAGLIVKAALAQAHGSDAPWMQKHMADHRQKLFHAIWGPAFGTGPLRAEHLYSSQDFAKYLHLTRLAALYVDTEDPETPPWEQVSLEEVQELFDLTQSRLELERASEFAPFQPDEVDNLRWLFAASEDKDKFRLIFGSKSMERLAEMRDRRAWLRWVREQFEEAERLGRTRAEEELKKATPDGQEALKPKWKLRLRICTNSHTIRPKPLRAWNQHVDWIKLVYVKKKDELQVEFTLPAGVPTAGLYEAGLDSAKRFLAALNIGTRGFFWWYVPTFTSKYYEGLVDLESGEELVIERRPAMALDWQKESLSQEELFDVRLCFAMLPTPRDGEAAHRPYVGYLDGLAIMAKNDILLHAEGSAYYQFYRALKAAFSLFDDWDGSEPFSHALARVFGDALTEDTIAEYSGYGERLEERPDAGPPLTISEVGAIKLLCDAYFTKQLRRKASNYAALEQDFGVADS